MAETPLELTMSVRDVSVTEKQAFRNCRRRWKLETVDNWTPLAPAWALEFGTGIHSALEALYLGRKDEAEDPEEAMFAVWDEWYSSTIESQQKLLGPLFTEAADQELYDLAQMGVVILTNYLDFDAFRNDPWEIIAVEGNGIENLEGTPPYGEDAHPFLMNGRFLVPIIHPDTKQPLPGRPYLSARIDLVAGRRSPKGIWVVDHKTAASAPDDRGLDFDDQCTGYNYVVWRATGVIPRGTLFNYLVKKTPKDPKIVQKNKSNPSGLSTDKSQLCLPSDYRAHLKAFDLMLPDGTITSQAHADCYAGLLAKGWDPFFRRFEPRRNEIEMESYEEYLYYEYMEMSEVGRGERYAYPNLSTWHCPSCGMAPLCQAMNDGSDVQDILDHRYTQAEDRKA